MMTKKLKRTLIEYGVIGTFILTLFLTGLHTEVFGFIQRGILQTGLMDAEVKEKSTSNSTRENPPADFNMKLVNSKGEKVDMKAFKGKVIFMNFWATWCPPCIAEMPGINKLYSDMKGEDVVFLMLSLDDNFEKAKRFKERKGFDFEVYHLEGSMLPMYYSQSIPTTFVIDSKGDLALTQMGMAEYHTQEFKDFLQTL